MTITVTPEHRAFLRFLALLIAVVLFFAAWFVSVGNAIDGSHNAAAFGYAGLFFFGLASFLP